MALITAKPAMVMHSVGSTTNQCQQSGALFMTNKFVMSAEDASLE